MFGRRKDGKRVKHMNIIDKAEPFFMPMRIDAVNYAHIKIDCEGLDEFIKKEREKGNHISYMHVVIATIVRILYVREKLNRFVMNDIIYQRNGIYISMDVKKSLSDDGEILTLKFPFKGTENLYEVKKIIDDEIAKNLAKDAEEHATTKNAENLTRLPAWLLRIAMRIVRFCDRHGILTGLLLKASPFHTSCFLTNLKSIKLNYIYHHLYNFGTTTVFVSMGKEQMEPVVLKDNTIGVAKIMNLGFSLDERVADGLYMGKSLRFFETLLKNPEELLQNIPEKEDTSKKKKKVKKVKEKKSK